MSHSQGGRPSLGGVPLISPPRRSPPRPRERSGSTTNGERAPPPLVLATHSGWNRSPPPLGALPLNGSCDMSSSPQNIRPPRPHPVGARPVPASSINSITPLPPPPAPLLNSLQGAFTNGRRRRRSSMSPTNQFQVFHLIRSDSISSLKTSLKTLLNVNKCLRLATTFLSSFINYSCINKILWEQNIISCSKIVSFAYEVN